MAAASLAVAEEKASLAVAEEKKASLAVAAVAEENAVAKEKVSLIYQNVRVCVRVCVCVVTLRSKY